MAELALVCWVVTFCTRYTVFTAPDKTFFNKKCRAKDPLYLQQVGEGGMLVFLIFLHSPSPLFLSLSHSITRVLFLCSLDKTLL